MFAKRPWLRTLAAVLAAGAGASRAADPAAPSPSSEASSAAEARAAMAHGRMAMEDELYPVAERQFRSALDVAFSEGVRTTSAVWLARSLIAQGRAAEAMQLLNTVTNATDAAAANVSYWRARAAYESGDAGQSLSILNAESPVKGEDRLALRARALVRAQRMPEAIAAFAEFEKQQPASPLLPSLMLEWAAAHVRQGEPRNAAVVLERLLKQYPQNAAAPAARLLLGQVMMADHRWPEAERLLRDFAGSSAYSTSDRAQALLTLAGGYEVVPDLAAANAALDQAVELARGTRWMINVNLSRARLRILAGGTDEGHRLIREAVTMDRADPQVADTQLFLADRLLDAEKWAAAADEYQYYLDTFENPAGVARARMGRGWALLALSRPAEAAGEFERAAKLFPDPAAQAAAWLKAADAHFAAQAYESARAIYLKQSADPSKSEAASSAFQAAECLRQLKQPAAARGEYLALMERWPEHELAGRAALRVAALYEGDQQWNEAIGVYSNALVRYPDPDVRARAMLGRGVIRYRLGEFAAARGDFDEIVRLKISGPAVEQAFYLRGWSAFLLGREDEALDICQQFIERYPQSQFAPDVQFWLAERAYNRGDFTKAEGGFAKLPAQFPASRLAPEGWYWAGRAAMGAREYDRALEYFGNLFKGFPGHARTVDARFSQADALYEQGKFAEAILALDEVIRAAPDSYLADLAWGRKGDCHFTMATADPGRFKEALQAYKTLRDQPLAKQDLRLQAEYKMGRCEEKIGNADAALDHFTRVMSEHVTAREQGGAGAPMWFARAGFAAAEEYERRQQWPQAMRLYQRLVEDGGAATAEATARMERIQNKMSSEERRSL